MIRRRGRAMKPNIEAHAETVNMGSDPFMTLEAHAETVNMGSDPFMTSLYDLYVMFLPPGANSVWVPVEMTAWKWAGTAVDTGAKDANNNDIWQLTAATQPMIIGTFIPSEPP